MKKTNMEYFRSEIEEILNQAPNSQFGLRNGVPVRCLDMDSCNYCGFGFANCCENLKIKWLMSEYKAEPVLTQTEKHFIECVEYGWMTRDENEDLVWHDEQPWLYDNMWDSDESHIHVNAELFPFITWEDKRAWSIEALRKLKVCNED